MAANAVLKAGSRGPSDGAGLVPPMLLVGDGADKWAAAHGIPTDADPRSKITEDALTRYAQYMDRAFPAGHGVPDDGGGSDIDSLQDTVGAVCIDASGAAAAGVSSGGIALKLPGRAAMFGCGCWAESRTVRAQAPPVVSACSVSGTGEQIMRTMLARDCARRPGDMFSALDECLAEFCETSALRAYTQRSAGLLLLRHDPDDGSTGK
ncbi:hypothetical protein LPJ61_006890 [Coemansia biformis]|uniref:N-terminal nucleophile aminohydrolase n=1 Tax=Coemansia biformis TaxID=1286918 RepID=A0A9W7XT48_9FUNG|nr:hypothetical protein LPJ61_006890 [Coemansia biformis]